MMLKSFIIIIIIIIIKKWASSYKNEFLSLIKLSIHL